MKRVWKCAVAGGMAACLYGSVLLVQSVAEQQYSSRRVAALDYSNDQNFGSASANDNGPIDRADSNSGAAPQYPLPAPNQSAAKQANYVTPGTRARCRARIVPARRCPTFRIHHNARLRTAEFSLLLRALRRSILWPTLRYLSVVLWTDGSVLPSVRCPAPPTHAPGQRLDARWI